LQEAIMDFLDRWFDMAVLKDEAEARRSFKSLYRVGFAVLCASTLFLILSSIRAVQVPFLIVGAMMQIDAVLLFLYAGVLKALWELSRKLERPGTGEPDAA